MDDDQLLWYPSSSTSRRPLQLPLNLRTSSNSAMGLANGPMFTSRSARVSNIFSSEEDEDDPFELHKFQSNNNKAKVLSTFPVPSNQQIGLLVDIGTDSPSAAHPLRIPERLARPRNSDIGLKLQSALDDGKDDSVLSLKLSESDLMSASPEFVKKVSPGLNNAFTDWDRLQNEASAIASDIKLMKTPSSLGEKISLASFSPAINSPQLIPLDEMKLVSNDDDVASPVILPAKLLSFTKTSGGANAKKKLPFAEVQSQCLIPESPRSKPPSVVPSGLSSCEKENSSPLISFDSPNEVFLDDQLERAIKAIKIQDSSSVKSSGSLSKPRQSTQYGNSTKSFSTRLSSSSSISSKLASTGKRLPSAAAARGSSAGSSASKTTDNSLREKSLISSTPLVPKVRRSFYGPGGQSGHSYATPIKPTASGVSHIFQTPRATSTVAKPSPIKPSIQPVSSAAKSSTKSRYSLATPLQARTTIPSPQTSRIATTPSRISSTPSRSSRYSLVPTPTTTSSIRKESSSSTSKSLAARSLCAALTTSTTTEPKVLSVSAASRTPQIAKPGLSRPQTASKLQALKQGQILKSKMVDVRSVSKSTVESAVDKRLSIKTPIKIPSNFK